VHIFLVLEIAVRITLRAAHPPELHDKYTLEDGWELKNDEIYFQAT
jgi:hypothetical protein